MDMLILNLTIAIGTYLGFIRDGGSFEGGLEAELEYALRDWRPEYTCVNLLTRSLLGRILEESYRPAMEAQLAQSPLLYRMVKKGV